MVPIQPHRKQSDYVPTYSHNPDATYRRPKGSFGPSTASSANARATTLKTNPLLDKLGEETDQSFYHYPDSDYQNFGFLEA